MIEGGKFDNVCVNGHFLSMVRWVREFGRWSSGWLNSALRMFSSVREPGRVSSGLFHDSPITKVLSVAGRFPQLRSRGESGQITKEVRRRDERYGAGLINEIFRCVSVVGGGESNSTSL